jgi:hypothetical protein
VNNAAHDGFLFEGVSAGVGDVVDRVADRLELRQLVVGDLDPELVLSGHGHLDHRQRVDVEVVGERLVVADVGRVDVGNLVQDFGETRTDLIE